MKVDDLSRLPVHCRKLLLHSDLSADLGCWTDISTTGEWVSVRTYVRIGEVRDILALGWCPGVIVFLL